MAPFPAPVPIQLNGVTFLVRSADRDDERIGAELQAADGSRRFAFRAVKKKWTIKLEGADEMTVRRLRAVYALTSTFVYVDETGEDWVVFCGADALKVGTPTMSGTAIYYDATITVKEA